MEGDGVKLFGTRALITPSRKDFQQDAGMTGAVAITLIVGGILSIIAMAVEGRGCLFFVLGLTATILIALFLAHVSGDRKRQHAAREARAQAAAALAAEEAKKAREAATAARVNALRKGALALARRVHDMTPEQFVAEVEAVKASSGVRPREWTECREGIFIAVFWDFCSSDADLTEHEEAAIAALGSSFGVGMKSGSKELQTFQQFRKFRAATISVPCVEPPVPLHKDEICHLVTNGIVYTPNGDVLRSGTVLLTNKRVLVVGNGTTDIRLDKILTINMEARLGTISLTVDGRENAVELRVDEVLYFGLLADHVGQIRRNAKD